LGAMLFLTRLLHSMNSLICTCCIRMWVYIPHSQVCVNVDVVVYVLPCAGLRVQVHFGRVHTQKRRVGCLNWMLRATSWMLESDVESDELDVGERRVGLTVGSLLVLVMTCVGMLTDRGILTSFSRGRFRFRLLWLCWTSRGR
jgi:hypothetical protein